jgi:hypothetical protein
MQRLVPPLLGAAVGTSGNEDGAQPLASVTSQQMLMMMRDAGASRLVEAIYATAPPQLFDQLVTR